MSPIHSSRICKDHFTILAFSAIYPFFSRPSSSMIIIVDDDEWLFWHASYEANFLNSPGWPLPPQLFATPTSPCSPFPIPLWADELESGDFLKWMKTQETHSSLGSDALGHVFVVWAAVSPYMCPPLVKPAAKLQRSCPQVLTPGGPEGLKTCPKPSQKQRFLVIKKWDFSSYLWGWGEAAKQQTPRTLNHPWEETGPFLGAAWKWQWRPAMGSGSCTGPCRGTPRRPVSRHVLTGRRQRTGFSYPLLCLGALGCLMKNLDPFSEASFQMYKTTSQDRKGNWSYGNISYNSC